MQQIRESIQPKKIINGHFFIPQKLEQIILVSEYQLLLIQNGKTKQLLKLKEQIVDAIKMKYQNKPFDCIALLYCSGKIAIYNLNDDKFEEKFKQCKITKSRPSQLFCFHDFLFICDYISGLTIFNIATQNKISLQKKIKNKVLHISENQDIITIYFQDNQTQKLILYPITLSTFCQKAELVEKIVNTNISVSCSQLLLTEQYLLIYSYHSLKVYSNDDQRQEIADYSDLVKEIVNIHCIHLSTNQFLMILGNGLIESLTILQNHKVNHQIVGQLQITNIFTSYLSIDQKLYIVSQYGLNVFDLQLTQLASLEFKYFLKNIFVFQNNLYVTKNYTTFSKLFQIKPFRKPIALSKELNLDINKEIIQSIDTILIYNIIITSSRILLYNEAIVDEFQFSTSHQLIFQDHIIVSNDCQLLLIKISDQHRFVIMDKQQVGCLILQKYDINNYFTLFNNLGQIQILLIENNKISLFWQSDIFFDLSSYYLTHDHLVFSNFSSKLKLMVLDNDLKINNHIDPQIFQLQSCASYIGYHEFTYSVITQTGQFYTFDDSLQLLRLINLFGTEALVDRIISFENNYLIKSFQNEHTRFSYLNNGEVAEITLELGETLLMNTQGQLIIVSQSKVAQVLELSKSELDLQDTMLLQNQQQQIVLLNDQFLVSTQFIYQFLNAEFQPIYTIEGELTSVDLSEKHIVLLIANEVIVILKVKLNGCKEVKRIMCERHHQLVKLSKDILITTSFNEVIIYSLKSYRRLDAFKAIFPDKKVVYEENQIKQIYIECHNEQQLMFDLLINQAGIAVIILKINNNNENQEYKLSKKYHSPINICEFTRMQMVQNTWNLFNTINQCHSFKQVQFFFDGCLKQIHEKPTLLNDIVIDSILFEGVIYYLGVAGGCWKQQL